MKRLLLLSLFVLLLVGCGPSFDEDGLNAVRDYAEEIIPAVDQAGYAIALFVEGSGESEELEGYIESIRAINDEHWDSALNPQKDGDYLGTTYDEEEISGWLVKMSRGQHEWDIIGTELSDAVYDMQWYSDYLAEEIENYLEDDSEENLLKLADVYQSASETKDELRMILFNQ